MGSKHLTKATLKRREDKNKGNGWNLLFIEVTCWDWGTQHTLQTSLLQNSPSPASASPARDAMLASLLQLLQLSLLCLQVLMDETFKIHWKINTHLGASV